MAAALDGEHMKWRVTGWLKGVLERSRGVMRTRGVKYANLNVG